MAYKMYSEKLKDPRWQRKRLEILDRDEFTCQHCHANTKTLHVHHLDYLPGKEPWDYENYFLLTLCEDCHEEETKDRGSAERLILGAIRIKFRTDFDRHSLYQFLAKMQNADYIAYLLRDLVDYPAEVEETLKGLIIKNKRSNLV
jgi:hypothetical protein